MSPGQTDKAVILARGLGTRMRRPTEHASLSDVQAAVAETGVKAMIPIATGPGEPRPFLDYVLTALADAGVRRVCLVVGPEHGALRDHYRGLPPRRVEVSFAVQPEPKGTADAVASAESFAAGDDVILINSDNYYPPDALRVLVELDGPGLIGFERDALLAAGNIAPDRVRQFAVIECNPDSTLREIREKPGADEIERLEADGGPICVSMNCWRLGADIFNACRAIPPSPRGEYELPDAVRLVMRETGTSYRVIRMAETVLDLSRREDIESVQRALAGREVNL